MKTFEEYLEEKFDEDFNGTKDQAESALDSWFENLDVQELIDYGDRYAKLVERETVSEIQSKLTTQLNSLYDATKKNND